MAYSELIKNFNRIRDYMREFYVFGFKSREEYTKKSARSYDDERRRIESWLGDYMGFRQTPEGKNVFLSIDSRLSSHNPLYKAWKTKSFTDGDITLHFILFDILSSQEISLSLKEITERVDDYLSGFDDPKTFDESTVRKKLKEYVSEGIIDAEKVGKTIYYRRNSSKMELNDSILDFFSEAAPVGVVGSYLLDKGKPHEDCFAFKHHYITGTLDSEVLCSLLEAISEKREVALETINRKKDRTFESHVIPLKVMLSTQSGRNYCMAYSPKFRRINAYRMDNILSAKLSDKSPCFDEYKEKLDGMLPHLWGVSTQGHSGKRMEHVEFTVKYSEGEEYIHQRLVREKRCGTVEKLDDNTSRFSADVYDAEELIPWIRTFICRITDLKFSDEKTKKQFDDDLEAMYELYGLTEASK